MKTGDKLQWTVVGIIGFTCGLFSLDVWREYGILTFHLFDEEIQTMNWRILLTMTTEIVVLMSAIVTLILEFFSLVEKLNEEDENELV